MATIQSLFARLQATIQSELQQSASIDHPTDKGDNTEESWRIWLNKYLPKRYKIEKATIIDSNDNISQQIDAVVYDTQYSYLAFKERGVLYLPAESVYAIFEIKPTLNKKYLEYAGEKAASVRALYRTSAPINHAGGVFPPKTPFPILAGILTTNSLWTPAFGDPFKETLKSFPANKQIDCGCVISDGSFFYDSTASALSLSAKEDSLINFFFQLLIHLQKMGTVPAIELSAYAKKSKIKTITI